MHAYINHNSQTVKLKVKAVLHNFVELGNILKIKIVGPGIYKPLFLKSTGRERNSYFTITNNYKTQREEKHKSECLHQSMITVC